MAHLIFNDDCLIALKDFPDNSIDSLVTDPPAGIAFMGKAWDEDKGGRKEWCAWMEGIMREALRVMKPGAHGLVWALPRTSHWTATALEDAGFEVRDCITHLFGSGFPKSLDISKAIDRAAGVRPDDSGKGFNVAGVGKSNGGSVFRSDHPDYKRPERVTDAAKQWQGWGTALKPAAEFWYLVRKPLSEKTVAANVLRWGTGGLNIDGCRIGISESDPNHRKPSVPFTKEGYKAGVGGSNGRPTENLSKHGRFPANLLLSHSPYCEETQCDIECAVRELDAQSGESPSAGKYKESTLGKELIGGPGMFGVGSNREANGRPTQYSGETGGASRFFYCAKISASERNAGLEGKGNTHPTVKPQKLMRYLCKLVTPPGGTVLDPFMGSGSTGLAAKSEGFEFIGIEKEEEYFKIAEKRLENT